MSGLLTGREGEALVRLARAAIEDRLRPADLLAAARRSIEMTGGLVDPRGVFVTLELREPAGGLALRGCVGSTEASSPAHEAVVDAAIHAAFHDPRFSALTLEEYPSTAVFVSALTPPTPVPAPDAIVPGEHGVILEHPHGRGVFLPEVAAELDWTVEQLLVALCRKAGVGEGAWRDGTLLTFTSQKFGGW